MQARLVSPNVGWPGAAALVGASACRARQDSAPAIRGLRYAKEGTARPEKDGNLENYVTLEVTTTATVSLPKGTVPHPKAECGVVLPSGKTLKFWVVAELVDDENDVYRNLNTAELHELDVSLEPTGGELV